MELENVVGNLRYGYSQLEKGSFRQVDQLQEERHNNHALRDKFFYTSDGQGYFLRKDGNVDWAITPESENLVLRHINDKINNSYNLLLLKGDYHADNAEAEAAKNAKETVVIPMNRLRLSGNQRKYQVLSIRTEDGFVRTEDGYQAPEEEEQKAMTRLGYTAKTLNMLNKEGNIAETRIYVPNPKYIAGELEDSYYTSLWRASWLYHFMSFSSFSADDCSVRNCSYLRGILKSLENEVPQDFVDSVEWYFKVFSQRFHS